MNYHDHKRIVLQGDQMSCPDCGRVWDANDPHPPQCPVAYVDDQLRTRRWLIRGLTVFWIGCLMVLVGVVLTWT